MLRLTITALVLHRFDLVHVSERFFCFLLVFAIGQFRGRKINHRAQVHHLASFGVEDHEDLLNILLVRRFALLLH